VEIVSEFPGIEMFVKQETGEPAQISIGPGLILDLGAFDLRAGVHAGLTDETPHLTPTLWVATKLPLR
jgi:hypothetical protein